MITQSTSTHKNKEHQRIDDLQEDVIKLNKLNSTDFERHLARVNRGVKRRQRNGHNDRLARFLATNH